LTSIGKVDTAESHPAPADTRGDLGILLAMAFRALTDRVHAGLTAQGWGELRPAHGFTFQFLASRGGATAVELAAHLGVTKQAATQLVDELERLGYVTRRRHDTDRRARLVTLSDAGWACIRASGALWLAAEAQWAAVTSADHLEQVRAGLRAYLDAVGPVPIRPTW
jgi:DNA-binding MarR family transcriptional regulator